MAHQVFTGDGSTMALSSEATETQERHMRAILELEKKKARSHSLPSTPDGA